MTRCLLVDDDPDIRTLVAAYLRRHGMDPEVAGDGAALRRRLPDPALDLLILDVMLPDDDGLALCQWVRQVQPTLPVIMLTAQGDPTSRVLGLELGADDYVPKPFEPRELVARIRAVLRRGRAPAVAGVVRFGGCSFDRMARELVAADGTVVALSAAEFRLLCAFVDNAGKLLSRERLIELTRAPGSEVNGRSIDLAVSRLRGKLGANAPIRTLRGEGYVFEARVA